MAEKVRLALIGLGYWGEKLLKEYLSIEREENVELVALVDSDPVKLNTLQQKYNIRDKKLLTSIQQLNTINIDGVHIATPNRTHYEIAKYFLERGIAVLVEKPMALSGREAFRLVRLSEINAAPLLVGHIFRFNNALRTAKELLHRNNENILYIETEWSTHYEPKDPRDIVFDLAPHPVDVLNFITGEWPKTICAIGRVIEDKDRYQYAHVIADFTEYSAAIKISWIEYGVKNRLVNIVTRDRRYLIDALRQKLHVYSYDSSSKIDVTPSNSMREMILHFIENIRSRKKVDNSSVIGALTVTVLEAIYRSINEKKCTGMYFG